MADFEKYDAGRGTSDATVQTAWSNAHAGFIPQNVYLFAASEALASWFRALVDAGALSRLLSLRASEKVLQPGRGISSESVISRPVAMRSGARRCISDSADLYWNRAVRRSCSRWRTNI